VSAPDPAGLLLLLALLLLPLPAWALVARWRRGRPAPAALWAGLRGLPRAYLHTVHGIVAREPAAARMHVLAAGGSLAALLLSLPLHLLGLGGRPLAALVLLAAAAALAGAGLDLRRRRPQRPARLSGGAYARFPLALGLLALFLALAALPPLLDAEPGALGWVALLLPGAGALAWLLPAAWRGPLRHALAGTVHLVAHPRPARPAGGDDTALAPLDLAGAPLGAGRAADFAWNRLAGFDSCVQCGRCEAACPAFAAGQPLNPKKLMHELVAAAGQGAAFYGGSPHPGLPAQPPPGAMLLVDEGDGSGTIRPETLWACTTCRACVRECPMLIEHVDAVIEMRRYQTLERGAVPGKAADALLALRESDTASGQPLAARTDWAAELGLPVLGEGEGCEVLLWLGEAAFERRHQRTLRALVQLLRRAGVDFAVLGAAETDCGDLARRLGDEATFQDLARRAIATLARRRFERIVTADPHALHALDREYPALGGQYRVSHHSTFLLELIEAGRLALAPGERPPVTYHDPCYLGRYMGVLDAPRRLLAAAGRPVLEMERSGPRSMCCGGGGGAALTDIPGVTRIPDLRMAQAAATGAATVAVACPYCAQMLEGVIGPRPEVADLAELVLAAAGEAA
jgi:Fe-S oxidoreductase